MKNFKFWEGIKHHKDLFIFVKDYNYILIAHTIPLLVLGMKIGGMINNLYNNEINGFIALIYGIILVSTSFSITHINFLRKYTHRYFILSRSGKIFDDIKFIWTLLAITVAFNIPIQFFVSDAIYKLLSLWLVQLPALFLC